MVVSRLYEEPPWQDRNPFTSQPASPQWHLLAVLHRLGNKSELHTRSTRLENDLLYLKMVASLSLLSWWLFAGRLSPARPFSVTLLFPLFTSYPPFSFFFSLPATQHRPLASSFLRHRLDSRRSGLHAERLYDMPVSKIASPRCLSLPSLFGWLAEFVGCWSTLMVGRSERRRPDVT